MCGTPSTNTHHRTPRGMGGSKDPRLGLPSNLLRVCGTGITGCHGWIESNRSVAATLGFLVRRGIPPTDVPVQLFIPGVAGHGLPALCLVFLTDDGWYLPAEDVSKLITQLEPLPLPVEES